MKKTLYIIPQIYVVKLHQQALMQYASNPIPKVKDEEESDPNWTGEDGDYNM